MTHSHHCRIVAGRRAAPRLAVLTLFGVCVGLISQAKAQTFSSSYTSTVPAADEFARGFRCDTDEVKVIGEPAMTMGLRR